MNLIPSTLEEYVKDHDEIDIQILIKGCGCECFCTCPNIPNGLYKDLDSNEHFYISNHAEYRAAEADD